ncbi:Glycerol-3-phosphate phosphatase [Holothuria leucospilota]|uniref:Glycerol-3-phosphate phosphatase n=1 Tax=Holothuria leucospilota TaxID=206669 RepID=A0A9Q0YJL6_HOLLE|nr:Glycerol-3-phosphate phosphatase [Holothuria leucospilota]
MHQFQQITEANVKEFLDSVDTVLLDCDGVLWRGEDAIPGSPETVRLLRAMGKQPVFLTNYSILSRKDLMEKFTHLGYDVNEDEIYSSATLAGLYLQTHLNQDKTVFVLGSQGLHDEIESFGVNVAPLDSEDHVFDIQSLTETLKIDPKIGAVVVAFDINFNYRKLLRAANILSKKENHFLVTNEDPRLPSNDGWIVPDCGCIIESVKTATKRSPTVLGKPNKFAWDFISKRFHVDPARTVMIGDSLNTDILFGYNCGIRRALVLSGISSFADVTKRIEEVKDHPNAEKWIPNYYLNSLSCLAKCMGRAGICEVPTEIEIDSDSESEETIEEDSVSTDDPWERQPGTFDQNGFFQRSAIITTV